MYAHTYTYNMHILSYAYEACIAAVVRKEDRRAGSGGPSEIESGAFEAVWGPRRRPPPKEVCFDMCVYV